MENIKRILGKPRSDAMKTKFPIKESGENKKKVDHKPSAWEFNNIIEEYQAISYHGKGIQVRL